MHKVESNSEKLNAIPRMRDVMQGHDLLLSYRGILSQAITQTFLSMAERKQEDGQTDLSPKMKVFNIMVECMQNICGKDESNQADKMAIFIMGKQQDTYTLYSGSVISTDQLEPIEKLLKSVNELGKEELKQLIDNLDVFGDFSASANAHIGLIDLANECGNLLQYNFENVDDQHTYFSLRTTVKES